MRVCKNDKIYQMMSTVEWKILYFLQVSIGVLNESDGVIRLQEAVTGNRGSLFALPGSDKSCQADVVFNVLVVDIGKMWQRQQECQAHACEQAAHLFIESL